MLNPKTTKDNPGAFKKTYAPSFIKIIRQVTSRILKGKYKEGFYGLLIDLRNSVDQRCSKFCQPRYQCSCCGYRAYSLIHKYSALKMAWHSACPRCDSRSRHRGLVLLLPEILKQNKIRRVLHIAPEPILQPIFQNSEGVIYQSCDLHLKDVNFTNIDLQKLPFPNEAFDLILCNHVLEHIARDDLAVGEVWRVLAVSGIAIITIPGNWDRNETITFSDLSLNGHYRDYGLEVLQLFKIFFSQVEMFDLHQFDNSPDGLSYAIRKNDIAFICRKLKNKENF